MLNNFKSVKFQRKQRQILSKKIEKMNPEEIIAFFNKRPPIEIKKRNKRANKTKSISASE